MFSHLLFSRSRIFQSLDVTDSEDYNIIWVRQDLKKKKKNVNRLVYFTLTFAVGAYFFKEVKNNVLDVVKH